MEDLNSPFQLLSTMSPKVSRIKKSKKCNKSPTKLALKKSFRKSAAYDQKPHSHHVLDGSIICINDGFEGNCQLSTNNIKVQKSPIIISSSESDSECKLSTTENNVKNKLFLKVNKWLSENEKQDDISMIYSINNNSNFNSDNTNLKTDLSQEKVVATDNVSDKWNVVKIETKYGPENLRNSLDDKKKSYIDNNVISSSKDKPLENDVMESYESILDELYGNSWRKNREKILPNSERKHVQPRIPIKIPISEYKHPKKWKDSHTVSETSVTPYQRIRDLCDSETEESEDTSSDSYKSFSNVKNNCKQLNFSDSDDEDIPRIKSLPNKPITKKKNIRNTKRRSLKKHRSNSDSSSSTSDEINFSESDNDSLGTRVRKRLAKKAKDLQNEFAIRPKPKLKINKNVAQENDSSINNLIDNKKCDNVNKTKNKSDKQNATKTVQKFVTSKSSLEKYSFLKSLSGFLPSWHCNADARFYRDNFKTHKEILTKKLFDLYNAKIFDNSIPQDTTIEWSERIRQTAGFCYNRRTTHRNGQIVRHCRIVLATKILDTADRLRDTLVHEMCHAATWIVHQVADGHGPYWKSWADKAMKIFPELPPIKRCHDYVINTKYTYKCMDCGYSIGRHSKSLDIERKRCGYCHGKFEVFINKTTKGGEKKSTPATPKGKTNGFALYVKENYSLVKKQDLKHGDVMKLLGQQFSAMKVAKN